MECPRCKKEVETMSVLVGVCDECATPKDKKQSSDFMKEINRIANEVL